MLCFGTADLHQTTTNSATNCMSIILICCRVEVTYKTLCKRLVGQETRRKPIGYNNLVSTRFCQESLLNNKKIALFEIIQKGRLTNNSNHPDHEVRIEGDPQHRYDEGDGVPATAAVRHRVSTRPVDRERHVPKR